MRDQTFSGHLSTLLARFSDRSAVIGIIGLGYVGLPLTLRYAAVGFKVLGIDIDAAKVARLNAGASYIEHIGADQIAAARERGFEATADFSRVGEADALIICVPTPLNAYREPDLSFVLGTTDALLPFMREGQLVSLESTTYPGTTEEELRPRLESRGFVVGENVTVEAFEAGEKIKVSGINLTYNNTGVVGTQDGDVQIALGPFAEDYALVRAWAQDCRWTFPISRRRPPT